MNQSRLKAILKSAMDDNGKNAFNKTLKSIVTETLVTTNPSPVPTVAPPVKARKSAIKQETVKQETVIPLPNGLSVGLCFCNKRQGRKPKKTLKRNSTSRYYSGQMPSFSSLLS